MQYVTTQTKQLLPEFDRPHQIVWTHTTASLLLNPHNVFSERKRKLSDHDLKQFPFPPSSVVYFRWLTIKTTFKHAAAAQCVNQTQSINTGFWPLCHYRMWWCWEQWELTPGVGLSSIKKDPKSTFSLSQPLRRLFKTETTAHYWVGV